MQQRLKFIRVCKSIVTSPSDMELWAREINHFSWFWCTWVNVCDCISWTLPSTDTKLVPLYTAKIEVYKDLFKHGDIPIAIGAVSPWSKPCFMVLYALVILCDHIYLLTHKPHLLQRVACVTKWRTAVKLRHSGHRCKLLITGFAVGWGGTLVVVKSATND